MMPQNPLVGLFHDLVTLGFEKFGRYYSSYRAFVKSNDDPKNLNRLQLNVPEVHGDDATTYWAWPASNYSGPGYGVQVLPRANDLVWVTFEKGNPRKPIWYYGHFGVDEKPTDLINKNLYWFRTPNGMTLKIDDDNNTITLYDKEKETIYSAALGEIVQAKLEELIEILKGAKINTSLGPQGFLPNYVADLDSLKGTLDEVNSTTSKTS